MVRPMAKKFVWISITLFPVFVFITQLSDFWVMSYGNWKHILGVFSFQNLVFNGIFVITPTCIDPLSVQHTWALLLMPLQLLSSPQTFSFFSSLRSTVPFFFFFFSPFSSQTHKKKKNQRLGQRIGCCGFVNFLGASRMLMNFVGLSFKLRTEVVVVGIGGWRKKKEKERKKKGMLGLKSLVLGGNGVRLVG